ncbi:MAG: NPCBM/NEW2 domain-containing protein, partial [Defluviitaleaceae bacterium]|nr:NPCBM/NEW2 domain-containing protein [Defluviitaleaceae bacterium]
QGFLSGILLTTLLFSTVSVFAAAPQTIEVIFGTVRTTLFGQEIISRDAQGTIIEPLTYNGTVFIPIDTILQALQENAQWDAATNTLNFGTPTTGVAGTPNQPQQPQQAAQGGTAFTQAVPPFDVSNANRVAVLDNVQMGGTYYSNVLGFNRSSNQQSSLQHSSHNLQGRFTQLSGVFGRIDGSSQNNVVITFIGDGRTLQSIDINALNLPTPINVDLTGVQLLRIEVNRGGSGHFSYALSATIR